MLRPMLLMCVLVGVLMSCGCRQDTNPPPRFTEPMEVDGQMLMPLPPLANRGGAALLEPIATDEQAPARGGRPTEEEEAVKLDDSTAEAAVKSFSSLVETGEMARLAEILVTDQAGVFSAPAGTEVILPVAQAAHELTAALDEKFPGHAIQIAGLDAFVQRLGEMTTRYSVEGVTAINDDEAEATLVAKLANQQEKRQTVTVRRSQNRWRLEFPDLQAPSDLDALAEGLKGKAEGLQSVAERVRKGEFTDEASVKAEVDKVMAGTYEAPSPQPEQESGSNDQAAPPTPPDRRPRERDAVDEVAPTTGVLPRG